MELIRIPVDLLRVPVRTRRTAGSAVRCLLHPQRSAERMLDALVPAAVTAVLRRVDLTALITTHVDLEKLLSTVDLPAIVRESTGSMVSDTVYHARMRGLAADEAVGRLRARLRGRQPQSR